MAHILRLRFYPAWCSLGLWGNFGELVQKAPLLVAALPCAYKHFCLYWIGEEQRVQEVAGGPGSDL